MNPGYKILWCFVLVFAAFLAGAPGAHAVPGDACSLLTATQVSDVLAAKITEGRKVAPNLCDWTAPGESGPHGKRVLLTLQDPRAFEFAKMPARSNKITKTPVTGIGDEAVYGTTEGIATTLTVKKGNSVFTVHVSGFPTEELKAKEKTLALAVLSKL